MYMADNIFSELLWIFPVYSFLGWCLEVVFNSVNTGEFVNRGFLNGAVCPIYGIGAGVMIGALMSFEDNLLYLFLGAFVIGSLLELVGGFLMKKLFHMSWWDYSDQPMNIGGYICLKFSLAWGIAGIMLMRVIHPLVAEVVGLVPDLLLHFILIGFYISFIVDAVITVIAVLKLGRDLKEVTRLSKMLHKSSDAIAKSVGNTAIHVSERVREMELGEKAREVSERMHTASEDNRRRVHDKLEALQRLNALLDSGGAVRSRLFKAFPRMNNISHSSALEEMRKRIESIGRQKHGEKKAERSRDQES